MENFDPINGKKGNRPRSILKESSFDGPEDRNDRIFGSDDETYINIPTVIDSEVAPAFRKTQLKDNPHFFE
jgi:hypothetical protein